jgi:hypothetical protein
MSDSERPDIAWIHSDPEPKRHNYVRRQLELIASGALVLPSQPGSSELRVYHDDWCALLVSGGYCDCNPEFEFEQDGKTVRLQ